MPAATFGSLAATPSRLFGLFEAPAPEQVAGPLELRLGRQRVGHGHALGEHVEVERDLEPRPGQALLVALLPLQVKEERAILAPAPIEVEGRAAGLDLGDARDVGDPDGQPDAGARETVGVEELVPGIRLGELLLGVAGQGQWRQVLVLDAVGGDFDIEGWVHGRYLAPAE